MDLVLRGERLWGRWDHQTRAMQDTGCRVQQKNYVGGPGKRKKTPNTLAFIRKIKPLRCKPCVHADPAITRGSCWLEDAARAVADHSRAFLRKGIGDKQATGTLRRHSQSLAMRAARRRSRPLRWSVRPPRISWRNDQRASVNSVRSSGSPRATAFVAVFASEGNRQQDDHRHLGDATTLPHGFGRLISRFLAPTPGGGPALSAGSQKPVVQQASARVRASPLVSHGERNTRSG